MQLFVLLFYVSQLLLQAVSLLGKLLQVIVVSDALTCKSSEFATEVRDLVNEFLSLFVCLVIACIDCFYLIVEVILPVL